MIIIMRQKTFAKLWVGLVCSWEHDVISIVFIFFVQDEIR